MIGRREFLFGGSAALAQRRPPNVILILADDLGWGEVGCYGQKKYATPNLDRLAAEGSRFTDAYAGSAVCAPSRCSLMTGMHTGHARLRNNSTFEGQRKSLEPGDFTVPMLFREAGYRTALFGKWGVGEPGSEGTAHRKGFDEFLGFLNNDHAEDHFPTYLYKNDERVEYRNHEYAQELFTQEGLRFVKGAGPYFLELAYIIPHAPLLAAEEDRARFAGKYPGAGQQANEAFAAMVTRLDRDVGRIADAVRGQDTLILFTSDNGPHKKGRDPEFFGSAGGFRGVKGDLYEGGIRVPSIARWPGHAPAGRVSNRPFAFCDFLPTMAELTGRKLAKPVDGESMLSVLRGGSAARTKPLYWELNGQQAVREGNWKAVRPKPGAAVELYDLAADPAESKDLAAAQAGIAERMQKLMEQEHVDAPEYPLKRKKS